MLIAETFWSELFVCLFLDCRWAGAAVFELQEGGGWQGHHFPTAPISKDRNKHKRNKHGSQKVLKHSKWVKKPPGGRVFLNREVAVVKVQY